MSVADHSQRNARPTIPKLLLIAVPILLLPFSILTLCYNYAAIILKTSNGLRHRVRRSTRFQPQTIVITGIATPAGLRVARALYQTGHRVVGVESPNSRSTGHTKWSKAVSRLHRPRIAGAEVEYIKDLLEIVVEEEVNMWIDCSDSTVDQFTHARAKRIIDKKTKCVCLAPDASIVEDFKSRHDFQALLHSLGLQTLETHRVRSRNDIHAILSEARGKKFVLSGPTDIAAASGRAVLPRRTPSQTYQDVSQLKITKGTPWILEQHIEGLSRYSTCSIVVSGKVKTFVACQDANRGLQMLPPTSGLSQAMRGYVEDFVSRSAHQLTTHLSIDFCVEEKSTHSSVIQHTLPVDARLLANPALALFAGNKGSIDLTKSYLAALAPSLNGLASFTGLPYTTGEETIVEPDITEAGLYQLDQSFFSLVLTPLFQTMVLNIGIRECFRSMLSFVNQICYWREMTYEFWDPLPAFQFYLTYTRANLGRWLDLRP